MPKCDRLFLASQHVVWRHNPTKMSNEKEAPTTVVFRKFKGKDGGDIIALFPELNHETGAANRYMVMSYMHIGQHGECDPFMVRDRTVPAKPEEYANLLAELKKTGYIPVVRQTINYRSHINRALANKK